MRLRVKEKFLSVSYYGNGNIIRKYAGFPNFLPLPVSIQHGWSKITIKHDAIRFAPENWYWSDEIEKKYNEEYPYLRTRAVGAPFLYLLECLKYNNENTKGFGSIVFPSHSTNLIEMNCNFHDYANMLDNLPNIYKPITVCMYYLDLDKGLDFHFRQHGFDITTNGTGIYDGNFLNKFIDNTKNKKYAFSNQMTSALLFASAMGLTSFFYGPQFDVVSNDPNYGKLDYTKHHRNWEEEYSRFFSFPSHDPCIEKKIVDAALGRENLLSKKHMKQLLYKLFLILIFETIWRLPSILIFRLYSFFKKR